MATTTNYGWTTPNDSDAFKLGASAIRTLGSQIDNTVFTNTGLVKINTTTVTAQTGISFNSVFTSAYKNYKIVGNFTGSTNQSLLVRMRSGTTDNFTGNYYSDQYLSVIGTAVTGASRVSQNESYAMNYGTSPALLAIDVGGPQTATPTVFRTTAASTYTGNYIFDIVGTHTNAASYDGITFFTPAGTITGTFTVYGYKA